MLSRHTFAQRANEVRTGAQRFSATGSPKKRRGDVPPPVLDDLAHEHWASSELIQQWKDAPPPFRGAFKRVLVFSPGSINESRNEMHQQPDLIEFCSKNFYPVDRLILLFPSKCRESILANYNLVETRNEFNSNLEPRFRVSRENGAERLKRIRRNTELALIRPFEVRTTRATTSCISASLCSAVS